MMLHEHLHQANFWIAERQTSRQENHMLLAIGTRSTRAGSHSLSSSASLLPNPRRLARDATRENKAMNTKLVQQSRQSPADNIKKAPA